MKATLIKNLSNKNTTVEIEPGQTLQEAFPKIDFDYAVCCIGNKKKVDKNYIVKPDDVITIRQFPAGATAAIVTAVVVGVVAVGVGVAGGVQAYQAKKEAQKAQEELEKVKKITNKSEIDNRPFLRNAMNTPATGNLQPFVCGRHLFAPYLLCNSFYRLSGADGKDQYTYVILDCGFNKQILKSISIEDVLIKTFNEGTPQEGAYSLNAGQVFADDGLLEVSQDGALLSSLPELNYKVVSAACNDPISRDSKIAAGEGEYFIRTLDQYAKSVDVAISFPYGLWAYNDENDKIETAVTITPEYSLDGGHTWTAFSFNQNGSYSNYFKRCVSNKEIRFLAHCDFSVDHYRTLKNNNQKAIYLRVRSNGNDDSRIKNDCYVLYYQCVCFDVNKSSAPAGVIQDSSAGLVPCNVLETKERGFSTMLGLRLKANKNNEEKLRKISVITQGTARTWNGVTWNTAKVATRNPAAWALEILTSKCHPASRFDDVEIDLESFGVLYEHCQSNNLFFDYVITQKAKKEDTLAYIMEACNAVLYWDIYGRLAVAVDQPQENAIAVYNPQNIINIVNRKTFGRKTDALRIKYINSYNDLFVEDTYIVLREGITQLTSDNIIKDMRVTGITTYQHVVKYARRLMALEALRPKATTIQVGNEGEFLTPLSKILLQDDSLKIGTASGVIENAVWKDGALTEIISDSYVTFEPGKSYGIIVNAFTATGAVPVAVKVEGNGYTRNLRVISVVDTSGALPENGNIFSFGELNAQGEFIRITTPYLINKITRSDNGFNLELVNYDENIYKTGPIPEYQSNITAKPPITHAEIPQDLVTHEELEEVVDNMQSGNIPIGKPDAPRAVVAIAGKDGINLLCTVWGDGLRNELKSVTWIITKPDGTSKTLKTRGTAGTYYFDRITDGYPEAPELDTWNISAFVENMYSKVSEESTPTTINTENYGTWKLQAPGVTVRESQRVVSLIMTQPARADNRKVYGDITHEIKIKRLTEPADVEFYKPATAANPWEAESNYKDGKGVIVAGNSYSQTLPLRGQESNLPIDTTYTFSIVAKNEAGISNETIVNGSAHATSIKDIVESAIGTDQLAQNAVTAEKIYVKMLSAIQSNLGYITGGIFEGTENNRWALSTIEKEDGSVRYEGAMRVGGDNEYFEVEPYNIENGKPKDYHVTFRAGNFEITAMASNINGTLYVMEKADSLDRTKITPNGTYYQHRETVSSEWGTIASNNVNGILTPQVFSDNTLFITNQDMATRRREGYDIGNKYLSPASKVYHFDTDIFDQTGKNDLQITDAEIEGGHHLVGSETESDDINFTPAILAIAPYSTLGRSLYGKYKLEAQAGECTTFTLDFWLQYIYAENQIIFDVGNVSDRIKLIVASAECFFEKGPAGGDKVPFNAEITASRMYNVLPLVKCTFMDNTEEIPFNKSVPGVIAFESIAVKEFDPEYKYYVMQMQRAETYILAPVTAQNYYEYLKHGLYEKTLPFNTPAAAHSFLEHKGLTESETVELSEMGVKFRPNDWLHIGVIADENKITVAMDYKDCVFNKYGNIPEAVSLILNKDSNSFLLDELLIDTTTAEPLPMFHEHTTNRIPWANLTSTDDYFIMTVEDLKNFKTNIFDSQIFKDKVTAIVQELIK